MLDAIFAAVRQLNPDSVLIALPTNESWDSNCCNPALPVFVVQRVTSGEMLTWGEAITSSEAIFLHCVTWENLRNLATIIGKLRKVFWAG